MSIYKLKTAIYAATVAALAMSFPSITLAQSAKAPASSSRGPAPTLDDGKEAGLKYVSSLNASEKIEFYRGLSRQAMAKAAEQKRLEILKALVYGKGQLFNLKEQQGRYRKNNRGSSMPEESLLTKFQLEQISAFQLLVNAFH
jgi:hypothetical protein